jgi:hypothetical protein
MPARRLVLTHGLNHEGQEDFASLIPRTYDGQAHLGGSGPQGRVCRECQFWLATWKWDSAKGLAGGTPKPARCAKFQESAMRKGTPVPWCALACKYFAPAEHPQLLKQPAKESA